MDSGQETLEQVQARCEHVTQQVLVCWDNPEGGRLCHHETRCSKCDAKISWTKAFDPKNPDKEL